MIDRIEELLQSLAAEEDEEQREDVPALAVTQEGVPASPRVDGERAGDGGREDRDGGQAAGIAPWPRQEPAAGETEIAEIAGELWKDGPVWTARGVEAEMDGIQRSAAEVRTARAEENLPPAWEGALIRSGPQWTARGAAQEDAGRSGTARDGLDGLYRQTVGGLRPAAPALPPEQAGRTARAQEPGSAASLAVDELDRAVRRDSRRYDGGMSIY